MLLPCSSESFVSHLLSKNVKIKIYKTLIAPFVLYGCETWSLSLREEHRLRVSEKRVMRRIFGPKRNEVTAMWRKLHNEELHNLHSSPNIIRTIKPWRMRWMGHVYKILAGKPEGRTPLGRPRNRWEHNIKTYLRKTGMEGVDWIHVAQDRDQWQTLVKTVMNLGVS
jgi:hypothetical protein